MTVEGKHDIIIKLSARAAVLKKKIGFFKKKVLTNSRGHDIIIKLLQTAAERNLEKRIKKALTKLRRSGIIT